MADFDLAYERTIKNEGGYILENVAGDHGGVTYAGIARNMNPNWEGWQLIDENDLDNPELQGMVKSFYYYQFWNVIRGDEIKNQLIADSVYDYAINSGVKTAVKLAQIALDMTSDGIIGSHTLNGLNVADTNLFIHKFAIAKIARYASICNKDKTQKKFLLGWINRTLAGLN